MLIYLFIVPFIMFTKNAKIFKKEDKIVYERKINYMRYLLGKKNYQRSHIFILLLTLNLKEQKSFQKKSKQAHCRQLTFKRYVGHNN